MNFLILGHKVFWEMNDFYSTSMLNVIIGVHSHGIQKGNILGFILGGHI